MFRRWRVRHSYPKPIVDLVVQLEPTYGAVALSRLLDIPTSVIYRWRTNDHGNHALPEPSCSDAEKLETLVTYCENLGFRITSHARSQNGRVPASIIRPHRKPEALGTLGYNIRDAAAGLARLRLPIRDCGIEECVGQRNSPDATRPSGLPVRPDATRRYVFDAHKERPACHVRNRMETARQTVDTQYFLDLDCRSLAQTAGMSLHHFIHMFGDMFGVSPYQYLMRTRVEAAKRLFFVSSEPIEVIAVGVGFPSSSSLNRAFKRIEGASVSTYCKTLRKGGIGRGRPESLPLAMANSSMHFGRVPGRLIASNA